MLTREGALILVGDALGDRDIVVGTTGMLSRELFEYRYFDQSHCTRFVKRNTFEIPVLPCSVAPIDIRNVGYMEQSRQV